MAAARVALDRYLHAGSGHLQKGNVGMRRKLKQCSQMLPFRGLLRFPYLDIWQGRFHDRLEGFYFARLHGFYEFLSMTKTYGFKRQIKHPSPEASQAAAK
jgi:hypothetical protein